MRNINSTDKENFGSDFITIEDENGNEFELEHLDTIEYNNHIYMAFLPADLNEDDADYGIVILKTVEDDGQELLATVDDEEELNNVYEHFMQVLFQDEE